MGKKFNETLKFLGPEYSVKTVDKEPCIYLKLDKYDFEISGLNSKGSYKAIIYVWNTVTTVLTDRTCCTLIPKKS